MSVPTVSCVIMCHNYGRYLDQAITSCATQEPGDYRLAEIVVIDDGSTDDTPTVCNRWAGKIKVIRRERQGFAASLTDAMRVSTGDWVALLDADDWFHTGKLRACAPHLRSQALLVQHWEYVVDGYSCPLIDQRHAGGNTSTLLVNRRAAQPLVPVSNEIFFHALREVGRGVELREPLTYYRVHGLSMTDRRTPGISQDYRAGVTKEIADRLRGLRSNPPAWATRSQLRRAAAAFRAVASSHKVEAAVQRGTRRYALGALFRMAIATIRAGRPLKPWMRSLVSVTTGRPQARLGVPVYDRGFRAAGADPPGSVTAVRQATKNVEPTRSEPSS
ncbi:MAG: glycosyltransferase family 2 protein [Micromonosporaceae bacterium]